MKVMTYHSVTQPCPPSAFSVFLEKREDRMQHGKDRKSRGLNLA